jgi:molecular chaperone GrpE
MINNHNENETEVLQEESCDQSVQLLTKEISNLKQQLLYAKADTENIRRNAAKEILESSSKGIIKFVRDLIVIIDDFERALEIEKSPGIEVMHKSLLKLLNAHNIFVIETEGVFNPQFHESIGSVEAENKNTGDIVSVARKGYHYNGMVIRPALVMVCQ